MQAGSRGIVIRTVKYAESSAICNIYCDQYGLLGFLVQGAYKPKSKTGISYLQPLNIVEINFNYKKNSSLQRITDIRCIHSANPENTSQRAMILVLTELLQQTIRENEINPALFQYLHTEAIPGLDTDIHFWQLPFVMLKILHHYGCAPNTDSYSNGAHLDLVNGVFLENLLPLKSIADKYSSEIIYEILCNGISHLPHNHEIRTEVLNDIIRYYKWHITEHFDLKSLSVLSSLAR